MTSAVRRYADLNDGTLSGCGYADDRQFRHDRRCYSESAVNFADLTNESGSASMQIEDVRVTFDDTAVSGGAITETGPSAQINVDAGN